MKHSYEEIRSAMFDVLAENASTSHPLDQYHNLKIETGRRLDFLDGTPPRRHSSNPADTALSHEDAETFREAFWDLFRFGVITLGKNESNQNFPCFRLTKLGERAANEGDIYFVVNTEDFEKRIRKEIPNIDDTTILYLRESFQAFRSGCLISSAVTLGVAAEHIFQVLLDHLESAPNHTTRFKKAFSERTILKKIDGFTKIAHPDIPSYPKELKESFYTHFLGIQSIIRVCRNDSGHPTGKIIDREQAFVNQRLFIPFGKTIHQLIDYYK